MKQEKQKNKSKRGIPVSISMSPQLIEKIDKFANLEGMSRSKFLGMVIYNFFKEEEKKNESPSQV